MKNFFGIILFFALTLPGADFDRASQSQQTAVAELIQSLKSTKKILMTGPARPSSSGKENAKNPFEVKQEYKMPPEENPDQQLSDLISGQQELNREMRSQESDSSELAEKQKQLRQKLEKQSKNSSGNSAKEKMEETEKMLASGKKELAAVSGQKAVGELRRQRDLLRKKSDRQLRESLKQLEKDLENNDRKSAAGRLKQDAFRQHKSGRQNHAEALMKLSKNLDSKDLKEKIEDLRMLDRNPEQVLNESAAELRELAKQLKYLSRHPETSSEEERRNVLEDVALNLADAESALSADARRNGGNASDAALLKKIAAARSSAERIHQNANSRDYRELAERIAGIFTEAGNRSAASGARSAGVSIFHPDDVPERYRDAVSDYFKRLSERGKR